MNPTLRSILAVIAGLVFGGVVNAMIVKYGGTFFPFPEGVDPEDLESIKANIHRYSIGSMMLVFFAHALGSLLAGFLATKIAKVDHLKLGIIAGAFFLIGGIIMVVAVGGPLWFILLDLIGAYIPMGMLGAYFATLNKNVA